MRQAIIIITAIIMATGAATAQKRVSSDETFNQGVEYFYDDAMPQAMQCFKLWLGTHPDDAYAWAYVAAIENEAKHPYAALDASEKVLAGTFSNPNDTAFKAWHYYVRSLIHLNLNDTVEAINDLNNSVKLNRADPDTYQRRATLFFKRQNYDRALDDYRSAAALSQGDAEPYIGVGCVYSAQSKRGQAIKAFTDAITAEPGSSRAYSHRAAEYFNNQEYDKAADDVLQALQLDRRSVHALWVVEYIKADKTAKRAFTAKVKALAAQKADNSWLDLIK
ncbi:MAG: hypothetical protein IJ835_00470 [Muribaculaceae bacterium]|nr:hypothetical protein [Muribaculaceae bacterium]